MGFLERLFQNNEKEVDSIYERRKERGEVPEPAIAHLNMRRSLEEQKKIVEHLNARCANIDDILEQKNKQLDTILQHKKSLIYEYVTGKKRVTEVN